MGQYHLTVNLDKKEFVDPHRLACGLKLCEQIGTEHGTGTALLILLAVSNGRGGNRERTGRQVYRQGLERLHQKQVVRVPF